MNQATGASFDHKAFLQSLSNGPGVYRMLAGDGTILYVGKARNLKRRVASYFRTHSDSPKTRALMQQVDRVEVTVTHTETEALILENNLIKAHRPRYNVLMRDDKSYPYIHISGHEYPRLSFYRGQRKEKGRFFGPYPSTTAVRATINELQKLFRLRPCSDSFFCNRTRPCLQYQINRCTAPCVAYITPEEYGRDVENASLFLEGRNDQVIQRLIDRMEAASGALDFEKAAELRDQVARLRQAQARQYVSGDDGDFDVLAAAHQGDLFCIAIIYIRGGRNLGSKTFFPRVSLEQDERDVLAAFLPQYYLDRDPPREIITAVEVPDGDMLEATLREQAGRKVVLRHRVRGDRARWLTMAAENAGQAIASRMATDRHAREALDALAEALGMDEPPARMECFDISHTSGESTVASCVVFQNGVPASNDYRRFNIRSETAGDDYAAMGEALERRYTRLQKGEGKLPDLLIVDGGRGQLSRAEAIFQELQVEGVTLLGVAKGRDRRAGQEQLFLSGRKAPLILPADSPALHLIQRIRDEAHRFAIAGHRHRRAKSRRQSPLEGIAGLGPKRRQSLLKAFGGLQGIRQAGVEDLAAVKGISRALAQRIYDEFRLE
ncbi:excinuclease ABC subunit UvrC [Natronospira bacteriovora]|uniref:UvrABC system protein C n=1 Tax=Natronospira bacteriovora TaxID=3069753 RepID=A0ABU0WAF8_9GAMM|nr:excinuclease ABC subunit UvrC [Natronospira sp. AB-CW4]MDQ2070753.1 excinuclease ABC subunit UvrC [Natronospira sp. AB-CW4]